MASIDIGKDIFEYGQTYVALSRIKSLDGLYLTEFYPHRIKANPSVIAFYDSFPKMSHETMNIYIHNYETQYSQSLKEESYVPTTSSVKVIKMYWLEYRKIHT